MKLKHLFIYALAATSLFTACSSDNDSASTDNNTNTSVPVAYPTRESFGLKGDVKSIEITTYEDVKYNASNNSITKGKVYYKLIREFGDKGEMRKESIYATNTSNTIYTTTTTYIYDADLTYRGRQEVITNNDEVNSEKNTSIEYSKDLQTVTFRSNTIVDGDTVFYDKKTYRLVDGKYDVNYSELTDYSDMSDQQVNNKTKALYDITTHTHYVILDQKGNIIQSYYLQDNSYLASYFERNITYADGTTSNVTTEQYLAQAPNIENSTVKNLGFKGKVKHLKATTYVGTKGIINYNPQTDSISGGDIVSTSEYDFDVKGYLLQSVKKGQNTPLGSYFDKMETIKKINYDSKSRPLLIEDTRKGITYNNSDSIVNIVSTKYIYDDAKNTVTIMQNKTNQNSYSSNSNKLYSDYIKTPYKVKTDQQGNVIYSATVYKFQDEATGLYNKINWVESYTISDISYY